MPEPSGNNASHIDQDEDEHQEGTVEVIEAVTTIDGEEHGGEEADDEFDEEDEEDEGHVDEDMEDSDSEEVVDDAIITITHHKGSVFCIDSHNDLVATGGEDDMVYVWHINATDSFELERFRLLFEGDKFEDSVIDVKFSGDGKYLAVCDMSGHIRVYTINRLPTGTTLSVFWTHDLETDIEMLKWHPSCNVLFVATSEGYLWMFKIATGEIKVMYSGDQAKLSCFTFLKDGLNAVCCYSSGTIRVWDLKSSQTVHNYVGAHEDDILCIDLSVDGHLVATAGLDMKIRLVNATNGKFLVDLVCKKKAEGEEDSIEALGFAKTIAFIACATLKGQLFIWDINSYSIRHKLENSDGGFCKLLWASSSELLYVSALDGSVLEFDGRNLQLVKRHTGHRAEILDFCLNESLGCLFTASNDETVKAFKIKN